MYGADDNSAGPGPALTVTTALATSALVSTGAVGVAHAQETLAVESHALTGEAPRATPFDIPPQPLTDALTRFAASEGSHLFVQGIFRASGVTLCISEGGKPLART